MISGGAPAFVGPVVYAPGWYNPWVWEGGRYVYSATTSPAVAKRTALQQCVLTFFGGSLRQMMTALVSEASWTDEELGRLKDDIDPVRKEKKARS